MFEILSLKKDGKKPPSLLVLKESVVSVFFLPVFF